MTEIAYRCWCDGSACSNPTAVPFTVCDECKSFGHTALPADGLQPEDVRLDTKTDVSTPECVFCDIVAMRSPSTRRTGFPESVAFEPLNPVVPGHMLFVPRMHVMDALQAPFVTGMVFARAAEYAATNCADVNLITSAGPAATQTVFHLHVHVVPRAEGDGLPLPWTS